MFARNTIYDRVPLSDTPRTLYMFRLQAIAPAVHIADRHNL